MKNFNNIPAQELYEICRERNCIEAVYQDIQLFKLGFNDQLTYIQMMTKENVPNVEKIALLNEVSQYFTLETKEFIHYFIDENNFIQLYDAFLMFEVIYQYFHLTIYTAFEMDEKTVNKILEKTADRMERQLDTYDVIVDKKLIGGIKLVSTDFIMDVTILNQLKNFSNSVM